MFHSINPYTQRRIATFRPDAPRTVERTLRSAERAFAHWRAQPLAHRADALRAVADQLTAERSRYAQLITAEMGKPLRESLAEVDKCALTCRHYADHAEHYLADVAIATEAKTLRRYVAVEPLGPVLAVMPWNFPFWQVFRFAAPAMLAGNVALLKHAPNVLGCADALEDVFKKAGLPEGVFQSLRIDTDVVATLLADRRVRAVTLTGSGRAGAAVAELAGRHIKKTVLELGGSDALIVLADADLDVAARTAVQSRMQNAGQSCIAAKRFIVERSVLRDFTERVTHYVAEIKTGDPTDNHITMGPLARPDLADNVVRQFQQTVAQGARVLAGGQRSGNIVEPMLLDRVRPGMTAFDEETFGPLAVIITARNEADAVKLANQSDFGLGAAVWSQDVARAERVARQIDAGAVFINGLVRSDPRAPFGGVKQSGYGRELADVGLREFCNLKTIWQDG